MKRMGQVYVSDTRYSHDKKFNYTNKLWILFCKEHFILIGELKTMEWNLFIIVDNIYYLFVREL